MSPYQFKQIHDKIKSGHLSIFSTWKPAAGDPSLVTGGEVEVEVGWLVLPKPAGGNDKGPAATILDGPPVFLNKLAYVGFSFVSLVVSIPDLSVVVLTVSALTDSTSTMLEPSLEAGSNSSFSSSWVSSSNSGSGRIFMFQNGMCRFLMIQGHPYQIVLFKMIYLTLFLG